MLCVCALTHVTTDAFTKLIPRYMVVMKRPSYSDFQWKTYIQEFHGHVWLLLLLSVVAMMLVIHVITAILPAEEKISLSESFTLVSGCIVAQGMPGFISQRPYKNFFLVLTRLNWGC